MVRYSDHPSAANRPSVDVGCAGQFHSRDAFYLSARGGNSGATPGPRREATWRQRRAWAPRGFCYISRTLDTERAGEHGPRRSAIECLACSSDASGVWALMSPCEPLGAHANAISVPYRITMIINKIISNLKFNIYILRILCIQNATMTFYHTCQKSHRYGIYIINLCLNHTFQA